MISSQRCPCPILATCFCREGGNLSKALAVSQSIPTLVGESNRGTQIWFLLLLLLPTIAELIGIGGSS
jgi:hypothetical protein